MTLGFATAHPLSERDLIRSSLYWFALIAISMAVALAVVRVEPTSFACDHVGDYAVIALSVEKAQEWSAFVGPYSRNRFFHPGPIFFYLYAAGDAVLNMFPSGFPRFAVTQAIINFTLLIATRFVVASVLGAPVLSWVFVFGVFPLFALVTPGFMAELWGPTTLLTPMLLFFSSAVGLALGRMVLALPFALSASLMLSNHVGALPLIVVIGSVTLASFLRCWLNGKVVRSQADGLALLATAIVCVGASFPPLYEALTNPGFGNIGGIARFIAFKGGTHSLAEAISYLSYFADSPLRVLSGNLSSHGWVSLMLLFIAPAVFHARDGSGALSLLRVFLLLAYLVSILGAMRITGPLYPFVMTYLYSIVALSVFAVILGIRELIGLPDAARYLPLKFRSVVTGSVVVAAAYYVFLTLPSQFFQPCLVPNPYVDIAVRLNLSADEVYIVRARRGGHVPWDPISRVVLGVNQAGFSACVDKRWGFIFGRDLTCVEMSKGIPLERFRVIELVSERAATTAEKAGGVSGAGLVAVLRDGLGK
jgi:hypothetical protein